MCGACMEKERRRDSRFRTMIWNSDEKLQGVQTCELSKEEDKAIHRLCNCSGKQR
jgi:hypothetical protein